MNLGLAIFLSSIFLGGIWLYYITRDGWNWKKIIKWLGSIIVLLLIVIGGILFYQNFINKKHSYIEKENSNDLTELRKEKLKDFKRERLTMLGGFELGKTQSDIKFLYGHPESIYKKGLEVWRYEEGLDSYILYFVDKKIISVTTYYYDPLFKTTEDIRVKWGEPVKIINFADDYKKLFFYTDYNLYFTFDMNKAIWQGIFLTQYEKEVKDLILSQQYF